MIIGQKHYILLHTDEIKETEILVKNNVNRGISYKEFLDVASKVS